MIEVGRMEERQFETISCIQIDTTSNEVRVPDLDYLKSRLTSRKGQTKLCYAYTYFIHIFFFYHSHNSCKTIIKLLKYCIYRSRLSS